jgi:hypothetical protein
VGGIGRKTTKCSRRKWEVDLSEICQQISGHFPLLLIRQTGSTDGTTRAAQGGCASPISSSSQPLNLQSRVPRRILTTSPTSIRAIANWLPAFGRPQDSTGEPYPCSKAWRQVAPTYRGYRPGTIRRGNRGSAAADARLGRTRLRRRRRQRRGVRPLCSERTLGSVPPTCKYPARVGTGIRVLLYCR